VEIGEASSKFYFYDGPYVGFAESLSKIPKGPQDAEFPQAFADLPADKNRVENVGEFVIAHARTRFTFFRRNNIICAVPQNRILVSARCIVRSIIPPAKSEKSVCG
jgi:hypothetical protein